MSANRLVIIYGQEGAGKTTTVRALTPLIDHSARIDGEDLGDVNPWSMDEPFLDLLWTNVASLTENYWAAGYHTVIAGSFISNHDQLTRFRQRLVSPAELYVVQLCAGKPERDIPRHERPKASTQEWFDFVDSVDPEDTSIANVGGDFRFLRLRNEGITVDRSIELIREWSPELFADSA